MMPILNNLRYINTGRHGIKDDIGWYENREMAASSNGNDSLKQRAQIFMAATEAVEYRDKTISE